MISSLYHSSWKPLQIFFFLSHITFCLAVVQWEKQKRSIKSIRKHKIFSPSSLTQASTSIPLSYLPQLAKVVYQELSSSPTIFLFPMKQLV